MRRQPEMGRGRQSEQAAAWPVVLSAVLLAAAVAAAVSAAMLRFAPMEGPRIASVRLGEMTATYATEAAKSGETPESVRAWGVALETALAWVAEREGVVLLPARAVAAGAPDMTWQVRETLAAIRARDWPDESGLPRGDNR